MIALITDRDEGFTNPVPLAKLTVRPAGQPAATYMLELVHVRESLFNVAYREHVVIQYTDITSGKPVVVKPSQAVSDELLTLACGPERNDHDRWGGYNIIGLRSPQPDPRRELAWKAILSSSQSESRVLGRGVARLVALGVAAGAGMLAVGYAVWNLMMWSRYNDGFTRVQNGRCEKCSYTREGLDWKVCPECGLEWKGYE